MKPLRLTMTAFGPYKEVETIDFKTLNEQNLYVISGVTGAGKTTIFDAICFALYGVASGSDRDNVLMLRSQFAEDDVHTAVEMVFSLSGMTYRIFRQMGHKKAGNVSRTGDRHEFYQIIGDEEIPFVDRQMVTDINDKVVELIGLSHDQFRQIVMLPQGEFRKLLTSTTENKEVILRKLFKTDRFQQMNSLLKEKRSKLESDLNNERRAMEIHIENIPNKLEKREESALFQLLEQEHYHLLQIIPAMEAEKVFYSEKRKEDERIYKEKVNQYETRQKEMYEATELNKQIDGLEEKSNELGNLQEQSPLMVEKEAKLQAAKKAQLIEPYERNMVNQRKEYREQVQTIKDGKEVLGQVREALEDTKKSYQIEKGKTEEREHLSRSIQQLSEFETVVKASEARKKDLLADEKAMKELENEIILLKTVIETSDDDVKKGRSGIERLTKMINENKQKEVEIEKLRARYSAFKQYVNKEKEIKELFSKLRRQEEVVKKIQEEFIKADDSWQHNQAYLLASQMVADEACPVCGSTHHPQKAIKSEASVDKARLDKLKQDFEARKNDLSKLNGQYETNVGQLKKIAEEIKLDYGIDEEDILTEITEVEAKGKKLNEEITALKKFEQDLVNLKEKQTKAEEVIKRKTEGRDKLNHLWHGKQLEFSKKQARFQTEIEKVPADLHDIGVLQKNLKTKKDNHQNMLVTWEKVQERLKTVERKFTQRVTSLENAESQLEKIVEKLKAEEKQFTEKLAASDFPTKEAYVEAKLADEAINRLEKNINDYKQVVHTLTEQVADLEKTLKGKERMDLQQLNEQLEAIKQERDLSFEQFNRSQENVKEISSTIESLEEILSRSEKLERGLSMVVELHDTVRGQNEQRISLERFLQIDFLEQIMQAANVRFYDLSNGQYRLIRSERQEARGRQSGLSIDVFDTYTSQKRDVKTLSGGEKFIASLCLALGMSDVIQSFQGSVSIETMFIDEGFGSLDEESLQKAIDALVHVQQDGRIIGVISHVDELKTSFPAMLEVRKTKDGFSETKIIVK